MSLATFQNDFKNLIFSGKQAVRSPSADIMGYFADNGIALHEGLEVYHANVLGNLSSVILKSFPLITALTGEDFAHAMAKEFVIKHPPCGAGLNLYGADYAAFIARFTPAQGLPYLADIARLEIAMNAAFYAADDQALRADDLSALDPQRLNETCLNLRKSAHIIESDFALLDLQAACEGRIDAGSFDLNAPCQCLVIRPEFDVLCLPLDNEEALILKALQQGSSLEGAFSPILDAHPLFDLVTFLQKHLNIGTFTSL